MELADTPQVPPALETPRLRLRAFTPADAADVERLAGERAIADTTLNIPHPYPPGAAQAWIATHGPAWQARRSLTCAITLRSSGALAGAVGLVLTPEHALAELGYWIAVPFWGRGFATEAARRLVGFGFSELGLHRVQARHLVRNPSSGRVMQKLGMVFEGVFRDGVRKWDRFEDVAMYAILAPEWSEAAGAPPA